MKTLRPFRIHLIDDDEFFLRALQHHLRENLHESLDLKSFPTGEDFLKHFPETKPDMIIVDHILNSRLPYAMDGRAVLEKIRQQDPRTPVVILSGPYRIEVALDSIKNGANDYVVKNDNAFLRIQNIVKAAIKDQHVKRQRMSYAGWAAMTVSAILLVSLSFMIYKIFFP